MSCTGDYLYCLGRKVGLSTFGANTVKFLLERPLKIVVILVVALVAARLGSRFARRSIEAVVSRSTLPGGGGRGSGRARTLAGVAASLVRLLVWTIAFLMILGVVGINLAPLLAGASIVGVALGFGAQSLVRDYLSGFFILVEDQFGVGDAITVADTTGTVEEVNLRVTRLRGVDGTVWFVPNGEIRRVGNSAKGWSRAIVDVVVPAGVDVTAATAAIADEIAGIADDHEWADSVLEAPQVLGVEAVGPDGTTVRVAARTDPLARSRVARELRGRIARRLRTEGMVAAMQAPAPTAPAGAPAGGASPGPPPAASEPGEP